MVFPPPSSTSPVQARSELTQRLEGPASTSSSLWLHSPAPNPPLRIGLLLDGPTLPRFNAEIIKHIQASDFARIELLVYRNGGHPVVTEKRGILARLRRRLFDPKLRKHAIYDLYLHFDNKKKPRQHPREMMDCSSMLSGIDSMTVEPVGERFVHRFPAESVEQIRARNLDVLIRFGFNIIKGDLLSAARYGVWSYHHGDNEFYRGGPPHFWELYERSPLSGVILQVLTEELDAGVVLCKSLFTTRPTLSVSQNVYAPYWGSTDLMIRKLHELHRFGWECLRQRSVPPVPYKGKRRLYRTPTNLEMARWLVPVMIKKAAERPFRQPLVQHWRIALRLGTPPLYSRQSEGRLQGFRWIESPKGHFWADPFLLEESGRKWMFFEDYAYGEKRASIACAEIGADGSLSSYTTCLKHSEHHYSYPYVFREGRDVYMVPEAGNSGSVDLYRCEEFPGKWRRQATLLRGRFVDPSIWQQDGLWWMMVTTADPDARCSALYLFYAEALTGPWQLHPASPISTDTRNNRGAGTVVWADGRLIRPSQSCCPIYGYSFSFNEVMKLSPIEYEEHFLRECKPENLGVQGTHTYNWIPGIEVIDGVKAMPRTLV